MIRIHKFFWLLLLAFVVVLAYCLFAGWHVAQGLKQMVTVGGPFTQMPVQTADPFVLHYKGDPQQAFGWPFENVHLASPLGSLAAWIVPPAGKSNGVWMIYSHGIGGRRENGYRFTSVARSLGITSLLYSYRNDEGAPPSPDGIYSFGLGEWQDLQAAVMQARQCGAQRIILAGDSMGAAIIGQYLLHARPGNFVVAAVLDAPALDLRQVLQHLVAARKLPLSQAVSWVTEQIAPRLVGMRLADTQTLQVFARQPQFLFGSHGAADALVPVHISDQLQGERPDMHYLRTNARHVQSWAENPQRYRKQLSRFLQAVMMPQKQASAEALPAGMPRAPESPEAAEHEGLHGGHKHGGKQGQPGGPVQPAVKEQKGGFIACKTQAGGNGKAFEAGPQTQGAVGKTQMPVAEKTDEKSNDKTQAVGHFGSERLFAHGKDQCMDGGGGQAYGKKPQTCG